LEGARRGLKFGATVGLVIWFIVACVCAILFAFVPEARHEMLADLEGKNALHVIGSFLALIGLLMFYGAVPGAIIMGIASMRRANRNATPDSN
jgi:hypothetical protein